MDKQNRAGYSPIMLTALATLKTQDDIETVLQLFRLGNVNAKASQVQALGIADQAGPSSLLIMSWPCPKLTRRIPTIQAKKPEKY